MSTEPFSTLAERVYGKLRQDITTGKLEPGSRLVRRRLASQLKVSPIPVTEALFRLESDGLVESAPMYGARVVSVSAENALDDLVLREARDPGIAEAHMRFHVRWNTARHQSQPDYPAKRMAR